DAQVGGGLTDRGQPVPGGLAQETERDVVGCPSPSLDGEKLRGHAGEVRRGGHEVVGAYSRGQKRLVRVPERGVGDGKCLLLAELLGERARADGQEPVAGALWDRAARVQWRQLLRGVQVRGR